LVASVIAFSVLVAACGGAQSRLAHHAQRFHRARIRQRTVFIGFFEFAVMEKETVDHGGQGPLRDVEAL